jgi:hypothetical protein
MATMIEIEPQEGDMIKGATGTAPVCVVRGELFWNGQFVSAYGGNAFELVSRSLTQVSPAEIAARNAEKIAAKRADELDRKYM